MAQRKYLNETGLSYFWGKIKGFFVKKSGDTMTGKLTLQSGQYTDAYNSGALDLKNSNIDGVNSIYTADASDNAQEGIHFYRDSTHVDSLHAKAGVLYFTPNRALGSAGTSNEVLIKGVSTFPEAYLTWGGRNHNASYGPIDAAMIGALGANRLELVKAAGIVVEYSRDNGATWTDYGAPDAYKMKLMSSIGTGFYIGKYTSSDLGNVTTNWKLRVTLSFPAAGTYTTLNKFVFYVSTNGASSGLVTIDAQTKANEGTNTWSVFANEVPISGWSGWNIVNTSGITTYGGSANSQYYKVRFTFGITNAASTTYSNALQVINILGFGGVGWTTPNSLARYGHAYTYDENINVTFPANITATQMTATQFNGNATGLTTFLSQYNTAVNANNVDTNGHLYYTSNGPATSLGATTNDGALYTQRYSSAWQAQIAQDYRNGRLFVRGKNNGSWTAWRRIAQYEEVPTSAASHATGISIANHGTSSITGVSGSVTGSHVKSGGNGTAPTLGTAFTVPNVTAKGSGSFTSGAFFGGSFTQGTDSFTANTPTVINTSKFSGGSFTRGTFSGGSGSFTSGAFSGGSGSFSATVSNHVMSFSHTHTAATHAADSHTHTAATHAADSFTAASLQSGFYTAGTAASFTQGTDSFSPATHAADSHTHTAPTLGTAFTIPNVTSVGSASNWVFEDVTVPKAASATTVVTGASHSITDNGHTHTLS